MEVLQDSADACIPETVARGAGAARDRALSVNPEKKYLQGSIDLAENVELKRLDDNYRREDGKISDKLISVGR